MTFFLDCRAPFGRSQCVWGIHATKLGVFVDTGIVIARRDVVPPWQSNIRHAELVSASL
ncbi:hypothetical protein [Rickettsia endosymbiont of Orchestes rusci]|uniref:hypothetical protein n=1 Tax=Rickettsia endosymbiont of Orchestes rusci TaxID=3066250 RepID=UPI00313A90C0